MSKAAPSYQEIGQDKWNPVMATITRIYRGAHGKLEILGTDVSYQVETEDKPSKESPPISKTANGSSGCISAIWRTRFIEPALSAWCRKLARRGR